MLAVDSLVLKMANALGADTTSLAAPTTFVALHLAQEPFVPSPQLVVGDLTEATFTGSGALHAASAATQVFTDPTAGNVILQINEPAGGWHWVTGDAVALPQTIYGFYLTNAAGSTLWASELLDEPVELSGAGQAIDIPQARLNLATQPLT